MVNDLGRGARGRIKDNFSTTLPNINTNTGIYTSKYLAKTAYRDHQKHPFFKNHVKFNTFYNGLISKNSPQNALKFPKITVRKNPHLFGIYPLPPR